MRHAAPARERTVPATHPMVIPGADSTMDPQPAPPDAVDDTGLMRDARRGDSVAFTAIMRRYNRRLYRTARAILKDDTLAEDALQDAYIAAFRHLHDFRGDA